MKRRLFFLLLCSGLMIHLAAQRIEVQTPRLVSEAGTEVFYPKFTPDGKTILLTSVNYTGLKSLNLESKQVRELTAEPGAGWNVLVSQDSKTLFYQSIDFSNDPSGIATFRTLNVETHRVAPLASFESLEVQKPNELAIRPRATAQTPTVVYVNEDLKIVVERNGRKNVIAPNGPDADYIWATLSPDGTKISYYSMLTGEVFICDLSGRILSNLGAMDAPVWLTNDWIVGMNEVNNGRVVTASNIVAITVDGRVKQDLTPAGGNLIAMFPAVSPDGRTIAFNTLDGKLYVMEISVK